MNRKFSRVLSVFLALVMMFSAFSAVSASAVNELDAQERIVKVTDIDGKYSTDVRSEASKGFYNFLDKLLMSVVKTLSAFFAVPDSWIKEDDYVAENFYGGTEEFLDAPAENARWSLGYSNASLLEGQNVLDGAHYVAGSIGFEDKFADELIDDLKVRAIAVNDGSGRGTTLFIICDAYGISNTEVSKIRAALADFAAANNIVSINVSVMHQHSAVDTFGMNGNIYEMVLANPLRTLFGAEDKTVNGKNDEYMENLYKVCKETAVNAFNNLETGTMKYTTADVSDYIVDKRDPQINDNNFNIFMFDPDNAASDDTYLIESMIHCVSFGASTTSVSGDYPYYIEKKLNAQNVNMFMFLGAQQSNTLDRSNSHSFVTDDMSTQQKLEVIADDIAARIFAAADAADIEVNPLLNVKIQPVELSIDNPILALAGKAAMFETAVVKSGLVNKYSVMSEIGYVEFGSSFAFTMLPGEMAPELAYGGTMPADYSWSGNDFGYPSLQEIVGDRKVIPMGLCNDQVGYIVPDNNYMSVLAEESDSTEFVSLGNKTASTLITNYQQLVESVK